VRFLRIKQAQSALADGRLDEAFGLAQVPDVQEHKQGQQLISQLTEALVRRGNDHLSRGQLNNALTDCNKAEKLAGNLSEIAKLRADICQAMQQNRNLSRDKAVKLAQAHDHIENGRLSLGERMLNDPDGQDVDADLLLNKAAAKRMQMDDISKKLEDALARDNLEAAVRILQKAPSDCKNSPNLHLADLVSRTKVMLCSQIRSTLERGRIDLAQTLLSRAEQVAAESLEFQELTRLINQCCRAQQQIAAGQPRQAVQTLRRIKTILPSAKWLDTAIANAEQATDAMDTLRHGPLSLAMTDDIAEQTAPPDIADNKIPTSVSPEQYQEPAADYGAELPSRFVVRVNGVGGFLVFREDNVKVGPISSSTQPDLGLMAEPSLPVATIARVDEDYFLRADEHLQVNKKSMNEKLLVDGDRIALSAKLSIRFRIPNAASTTAVLDLTSARLPQADIRHAILLDREIIIGPGPAAHIRYDSCAEPIVLYIRNGNLFCRSREIINIDNKPLPRHNPLPMEKPITIGQTSLVLTKL